MNQKESAAKFQNDFSNNRKALKNIHKLSDWFVKHRSFCAGNMRKRLGEILEKRFGDSYREDLDREEKLANGLGHEELQPSVKPCPNKPVLGGSHKIKPDLAKPTHKKPNSRKPKEPPANCGNNASAAGKVVSNNAVEMKSSSVGPSG